MISTQALSKSAVFSVLLVLVLSLSVACSNQSASDANSGYGSAPSTTSSPIKLSSVSESPTANTTTLAQSHWSAIAQGDLTKVISQYSESPTLQWIGGPLAGQYQGKDKIQAVWQKFIKAQAPLQTTITNVKSTTGQQGTEIVKALVTFNNGKNKIPVDYTLVYKSVSGNYQITEETWKIVKP
ncbi:nuclear transport factor 2 family protein [Nostoc sp.]|uniref:nuclear transport factor 2 family protein n=1 Tax=Nostoc sp. TaxID=1180 RepID=UPI002FF512C4